MNTTSLLSAVRKLHPRLMARNPVMFLVLAGAGLTTWVSLGQTLRGDPQSGFSWQVSLWLWFTVLFANYAEAVAEGRGKAQADSLRQSRQETPAWRLKEAYPESPSQQVAPDQLRKGDLVLVKAGQSIPADGEVVLGVASVDESAITGESAPVVREAGGDRSAVTGGTRVLSDWLIIRVQNDPGQGFLDRMIALVEGAARQKTPNEIALGILLASFSLIFLMVCASLLPFSVYSVAATGQGQPVSLPILVALLVCLVPTTIGGLLGAIGIAGLDRLVRRNVIAMSGRAVEAAGDIDVLLLDKTGTITFGNRQATQIYPQGVSREQLAQASYLASLADDTPEGKSLLTLAKNLCPQVTELERQSLEFIPFTAQLRMSGVNGPGGMIRKGAPDTMEQYCSQAGHPFPEELKRTVQQIAKSGATPLVVAQDQVPIGAVELKDVVKPGIRQRFAQLRQMGIRTMMITGDNPLTAAAIAAESGVDDFLAQATPEAKLAKIRELQAGGRLVAMTGDGTNDAPALAQADVAVAMNSGTQPAREAANMVDLDSDPTKLIEIVEIGKQLLMTRGALTTFSLANDIAKYFAIIPAAFASTYPILGQLDIMHLSSPQSAILSAVIFNALIIIALIPLALKGVPYRPAGAGQLLRDHLTIYGLGGLVTPFVGIKLLDMLISALGLA